MKVFISWSGTKSNKIAMIFRQWLPSVIQSLVPYVSSEDIDKGARWSTDIATELEDSTFGILCVTKENLNAPWLCFEAGALSKTMEKSFVTPFLFDVKQSEVNGPVLQFQSTRFEKEDIKKMMQTLNSACGETGISEEMLNEAFEVWYPRLEEELNSIREIEENSERETEQEETSSKIMEEILELSRDNQRLLRNPDQKLINSVEEMIGKLDFVITRTQKRASDSSSMLRRKYNPETINEFVKFILTELQTQYAFLIVLSMYQDDFPWIYTTGKELIDTLQSDTPKDNKYKAFNDFRYILEFTCEHPIMQDIYLGKKIGRRFLAEMHFFLSDILSKLEMDFIK